MNRSTGESVNVEDRRTKKNVGKAAGIPMLWADQGGHDDLSLNAVKEGDVEPHLPERGGGAEPAQTREGDNRFGVLFEKNAEPAALLTDPFRTVGAPSFRNRRGPEDQGRVVLPQLDAPDVERGEIGARIEPPRSDRGHFPFDTDRNAECVGKLGVNVLIRGETVRQETGRDPAAQAGEDDLERFGERRSVFRLGGQDFPEGAVDGERRRIIIGRSGACRQEDRRQNQGESFSRNGGGGGLFGICGGDGIFAVSSLPAVGKGGDRRAERVEFGGVERLSAVGGQDMPKPFGVPLPASRNQDESEENPEGEKSGQGDPLPTPCGGGDRGFPFGGDRRQEGEARRGDDR